MILKKESYNQYIFFENKIYKTCSNCRKYRKVISIDYKYLCKHCLDEKYTFCSICSQKIPYGTGKLCSDCYWISNLGKKVESTKQKIKNPLSRSKFEDYIEWLSKRVGAKKASLYLNKHLEFFLITEEIWVQKIPNYTDLLEIIKVRGLRKFFLISIWLKESNDINENIYQKIKYSELNQIESLMNKINKSTLIYETIYKYREHLVKKLSLKKTSYRSIRLALTPAVGLAQYLISDTIPTHQEIKKYLLDHQGQYAALTGYINFLKKNYHLKIDYQSLKTTNKLNKNIALGTQLVELMRKKSEEKDSFEWIKLCLIYFHDFRERDIKKVKKEMIQECAGGLLITFLHQEYWIPPLVRLSEISISD